jgi:hypothetical protein
MDDVIEEFYLQKNIPAITYPTAPPSSQNKYAVNIKRKQSQDDPSASHFVIGKGTITSTPDTESFISIETDSSGEIKVHSSQNQEQSSTPGATGEKVELLEDGNWKDQNSKLDFSVEVSSSGNGKKRIKYKNPKLPQLVILNSSTVEHPNPILISAESAVAVGKGSGGKRPSSGSGSSGSKGYSINHKKNTPPKTLSNPLDLPPYVFQPSTVDTPEYPYWVPPTL